MQSMVEGVLSGYGLSKIELEVDAAEVVFLVKLGKKIVPVFLLD